MPSNPELEQQPEMDVNPVMEMLYSQPSYRMLLYEVLALCKQPKAYQQVQEEILALPEMRTCIHEPGVLLTWLENAGGLERREVEGVGEWSITKAGSEALAYDDPVQRLQALNAKDPAMEPVFRGLLLFCQQHRSIASIGEHLEAYEALRESRFRPAYFVEKLEQAGGLTWEEKGWRTTEAGLNLIKS